MQKKAVIAGAGIGGLATAVRLASRGYAVTVFDKNAFTGGKLHDFSKDGFRFDFGPSLFTMPHLVDELFLLCGKNPRDYYKYEKIDTVCHYFWNDGKTFNAPANRSDFVQKASETFGVSPASLENYLAYSENIYQHTSPFFLERSLHRKATFADRRIVAALLNILKFSLFSTMHTANVQKLHNPYLVQLFNRYATYNGSDPFRAPGILNVIPWLEYGFGAFYPAGGMVQIAKAITQLAEDMGVQIYPGTEVTEICHQNGITTGVNTDKGFFNASVVVSNADMWYVYNNMIKGVKRPEKLLKQERSSSALVFYWGVKKHFANLGLHNIFFADDYRAEFDSLFKDIRLHHDPTVYINITSKYTQDDAPGGCENWFTMINVPRNTGQNWERFAAEARTIILNKLSKHLGTDIVPLIVSETITSPITIQEKTRSYAGSLYGTSSNSKFAAFLRHQNTGPLKGLYFCGGSVHPGGGIPLCLWSASITDDLIRKDLA